MLPSTCIHYLGLYYGGKGASREGEGSKEEEGRRISASGEYQL